MGRGRTDPPEGACLPPPCSGGFTTSYLFLFFIFFFLLHRHCPTPRQRENPRDQRGRAAPQPGRRRGLLPHPSHHPLGNILGSGGGDSSLRDNPSPQQQNHRPARNTPLKSNKAKLNLVWFFSFFFLPLLFLKKKNKQNQNKKSNHFPAGTYPCRFSQQI